MKCMVRGNVWHSVWEVSEKQFVLALANDKYANVICADMFNSLLITSAAPVQFGLIIQTISAVLGHNQAAGTLTKAGKWLVRVLDTIDPGHCKRAAEQDKYYKAYENWK